MRLDVKSQLNECLNLHNFSNTKILHGMKLWICHLWKWLGRLRGVKRHLMKSEIPEKKDG